MNATPAQAAGTLKRHNQRHPNHASLQALVRVLELCIVITILFFHSFCCSSCFIFPTIIALLLYSHYYSMIMTIMVIVFTVATIIILNLALTRSIIFCLVLLLDFFPFFLL